MFQKLCNIPSALIAGGLALALNFSVNPPQAEAASAFPDYMIVEVEPGKMVNEYQFVQDPSQLPTAKKPRLFYVKNRYEILSGKVVYDMDPSMFEKRLKAAATFCVRFERIYSPSRYIVAGTTSRRDEFTWALNPKYLDRKSYITDREMEDDKSNTLRACSSIRSFGVSNYGWDAFPESVRVQGLGRMILISGAEFADYAAGPRQMILRDNDIYCTRKVNGLRPDVGSNTSESENDDVMLYLPEMKLSGRLAVPYMLNDHFVEEEFSRCQNEFLPWLRRRGR